MSINTEIKPYTLCNLQGRPLSQTDVDFVHREKLQGRLEQLVLLEDEDPYATRRLYYCTSNGLQFEVVPDEEV